MKQAALIECSRRELAMTPESRRGAIGAMVVMAAFAGYMGVKQLLHGDGGETHFPTSETHFPTSFESWRPWFGALFLVIALVPATGALVLGRAARRERLEPSPTIRAHALENQKAAQQ